jgi:hypothetical protein
MDGTAPAEAAPVAGVVIADEYDGPLLLFADFMNVLGEHDGLVLGAADETTGVRMTIVELALDLPLELRVGEDAPGVLSLRGGPPTQTVATTVFPVLHRLKVRLARSPLDGPEPE